MYDINLEKLFLIRLFKFLFALTIQYCSIIVTIFQLLLTLSDKTSLINFVKYLKTILKLLNKTSSLYIKIFFVKCSCIVIKNKSVYQKSDRSVTRKEEKFLLWQSILISHSPTVNSNNNTLSKLKSLIQIYQYVQCT